MNQTANKLGMGAALATAFALLLVLGTGIATAQVRYLDDGAIPNSRGGWDLPAQGTCPTDLTKPTRPDCLSLRLPYPSGSGAGQCANAAINGSWSTGVCNDLVNITQPTCDAAEDRYWNAATSTCAIVMLGDDRNEVVCAVHGGTWVTTGICTGSWVMPARTAYTPNLLTGNSAGDQCLRCHNTVTEYNGPRVRDTEDTLFMGHKNMSRKVTVGLPLGGPPFSCSVNPDVNLTEEDCVAAGGTWDPTIYPGTDTGNNFHWNTGEVEDNNGNLKDLAWIYGDWLSALPRAIYYADRTGTCSNPLYLNETACNANGGTWTITGAGLSYSCGRCHTTGWTSDSTIAAQNLADPRLTKEPERSFMGITWDPGTLTGYVNLKGNVTGDGNNFSSWDAWGISCTRCHNSAIDVTTGSGSPLQYNAPTGMSTHHNNLTAPDSSGACTDPRWTLEAQCEGAGGSWLSVCSIDPTPDVCVNGQVTSGTCAAPGVWVPIAAGFCSNAFYTTSPTCTANGFVWQDGYCTRPDLNATTCTGGSGSNQLNFRRNGHMASCLLGGGTWPFTSCSIEGVCNVDNTVTDKAGCDLLGGQFAYARDIIRCEDAGGHWTGNNSNRGQIITGLCAQCHRQETGGLPYDGGTDPAGKLKVGPAHGTFGYVSHPAANQFLNSPHGKFSGTFAQIPTGKFNYAMTGEYKSYFMAEAEAGNTGNGCTGCHEVHTSTVAGELPFREECMECHAKNLDVMLHPATRGTPLEHKDTEPMEACVSCHMPHGQHTFRVSVDPTYEQFPTAAITATSSAQCTALGGTWSSSGCTVNAPQVADGDYTKAVWVDLDAACGKCHGGGVGYVETTGSINATQKTLTVAAGQGGNFTAGQRIKIEDAGALYYDDDGVSKLNDDFETYIVSKSGDVLTLAGAATKSVTNKPVFQNPTENGAGYMSRQSLAGYARGIHNDAPVANFTYQLGNPNTLQVTFDASASTCSGSNANCDAFEWNFGDGVTDEGVNVVHTYVAAGTKTVTLTVHEYGVGEATKTKKVKVYAQDLPPVINSTCAFDNNTWTMTVTDASTDDFGIVQEYVTWGDGSLTSVDTTPPFGPFSHTYLGPGFFTVTHKITDTVGQTAQNVCLANPSYHTISGTTFRSNGTTTVPGVKLVFVRGAVVAKTVYSNSLGAYSATGLKPGTYTIYPTKLGYTFPTMTFVIGTDTVPFNINATTP